ncbi:DUF488 family protein [Sporosarcina sp. FSL W7-1349]|uniref:DUF488 domain-containing protein n=1 Tax=Sporosarcina sp. FSL W7-1349 TaxID=2921561 RepID=UPI0030F85E20
MQIQMKRAYDPVADDDGARVLVDRLWPRGLSKEKLKLDHWMKEVAPSHELRKWFGHDPDKFEVFSRKYEEELQSDVAQAQLIQLIEMAHSGRLTLVYGAKDETYNQARVLKEIIERQRG